MPSTNPSDTPTDAPTDAPTDTPTDAPTDVPTTLGNITELKATKASQLTATFDAAVPTEATFTVSRGSSTVEGKSTIDGSTVVFDATANLTAGTYTLTATLGENKVSAETEVKDEYVAEIKLLSKEALTSEDSKEAYINYDVLNQYGESIRSSQTVNWTISSSDRTTDSKSSGVITIRNAKGYTYGTDIYITGVHVKSGTVISESVKIGMARAIDTVEMAGFLDLTEKKTILKTLPVDFASNKYVLLYQAKDQNGNLMDASDIELSEPDDNGNRSVKNLTFISDAPLLIKSEFYAGDIQTIGDAEYASVKIQPGQYVDRGGEVNITVISNKTGQRSTQNFVVGAAKLLQSLVLDAPGNVVADGDQGVKIPYTAKDTEGNSVTNYETIVRSTNALTLSASDGELIVKEENDGTAGVYWSDSVDAMNWSTSSAKDNINRSISLATIVVGGESNNMILEVSDTRRPNAIKAVRLSGDSDTTAVAGAPIWQGLEWQFDFLDQYGADMNRTAALKFFNGSEWDGTANAFKKNTVFDGYYYTIKRDVVGTSNAFGMTDAVADGNSFWDANDSYHGDTVKTENVKYSIVRIKDTDYETDHSVDKWEDVSKAISASFTCAPISKVSAFSIDTVKKQNILTEVSGDANGSALTTSGTALTAYVSGEVVDHGNKEFKVRGTVNGASVVIPSSLYTAATDSAFTINESNILAIKDGVLQYKDLYDENSAKLLRKDAKLALQLLINDGNDSLVKTSVAVSDAVEVASSISFNNDLKPSNPTDTNLSGYGVKVYNQYGKEMADVPCEFTVSDIKQSTEALTHLANSFVVNKNGSSDMNIKGAEIGDSFKIVATISGTDISTDTTITVGADTKAKISSIEANSTDKAFRASLGYDR